MGTSLNRKPWGTSHFLFLTYDLVSSGGYMAWHAASQTGCCISRNRTGIIIVDYLWFFFHLALVVGESLPTCTFYDHRECAHSPLLFSTKKICDPIFLVICSNSKFIGDPTKASDRIMLYYHYFMISALSLQTKLKDLMTDLNVIPVGYVDHPSSPYLNIDAGGWCAHMELVFCCHHLWPHIPSSSVVYLTFLNWVEKIKYPPFVFCIYLPWLMGNTFIVTQCKMCANCCKTLAHLFHMVFF